MADFASALGAGAGQGLDVLFQRMMEQEKLKQLIASTSAQQQETSRHNMAGEDILNKQHQLQADEAAARLKEATQQHADQRVDREQDNGRALGDLIPADTFLAKGDPAISQMEQGGAGSLLKMKSSLPSQSTVAASTLPGDENPAGVISQTQQQPQEIGRIKLRSFNQNEKMTADEAKNTEGIERNRHDLAMESKTPREPNPQPQVYFGPDGQSHAIQFVGGQAKEIPLPSGLSKQNPVDMKTVAAKKTGLDAVTRVESDIDAADKAGLIGPASGRLYDLLAKVGTTGDPAKDHLIGRLKSDLLLTKMHVDAGIGGTRAAASPLLLKNWEDLALRSSRDVLRGYTSAIRDDMSPAAGADATASPSKVIRYDMNGSVIK